MNNKTNVIEKLPQKKKEIKSLVPSIFIAILCILLSVADIVLLRDAFSTISGIEGGEAIILVLIFTALADFFAFEWGKKTGESMAPKLFNRKALPFFLLWACMGVMFIVIRTIYLVLLSQSAIEEGLEMSDQMQILFGNLVMIVVLALLYIGTGLSIATCFRNVFDADMYRYRAAKSAFNKAHANCARQIAEINEVIGVLQPYKGHYKTAQKIRVRSQNKIHNTEDGVMNTIIGKVEKEHGHINPEKVDKIKKEIWEERERSANKKD